MAIDEQRLTSAARRAVQAWGADSQWRQLQEECGELIAAANRLWRGRIGVQDVAEEVADVLVMVYQARLMLGPLVDKAVERKLTRLEALLASREVG